MKNHVFRPLLVVIGLVAFLLIFRSFVVPKDFGVGARGYMYGWHRMSNEQWWHDFQAQYRFSSEFCKDCHAENYESLVKSPHGIIPCEDCHGPALEHPSDPLKLSIDKSRAQCLRCHYTLQYPSSGRTGIKGIAPETHNPDLQCVECHNPHKPALGSMK